MGKKIFGIAIIIHIVLVIVYYIKNNKLAMNELEKKVFIRVINFVSYFCIAIYIFLALNEIVLQIDLYKNNKKNEIIYAEYEKKIQDEEDYYYSIIKSKYEKQSYNEPYIPQNFNHIEGKWDTGFVIEDEKQNQYVWVPCSNLDYSGGTFLKKRNYSNNPLINKYDCYDIEYKDFLKSVLENGGFYISRYEIGKENNNPVSKQGAVVWTNITQAEAIEISEKMYNSETIKSELINGYAYDTVIEWIINSNNFNIYNTLSFEELYSGRNQTAYNIFDISDNILELTLEKSFDTNIVRGFYNLEFLEQYKDLMEIEKNDNRFSVLENIQNNYTTFRNIIYKK